MNKLKRKRGRRTENVGVESLDYSLPKSLSCQKQESKIASTRQMNNS